jgi:uncharacterized transporter YbjL
MRSGCSPGPGQHGDAAGGDRDDQEHRPAVGYGATYPFGVFGPILFIYLAFLLLKPKIEAPAPGNLHTLEIAIRRPAVVGKRLDEVTARLPAGVQIVALREHDHNQLPPADLVLEQDDVVLAVAASKELLEQARSAMGEPDQGHMTRDRSDLDYLRVFASRPAVVGRTLGDLGLPPNIKCRVAHVRRGDTDLLGRPDLVLETGDRVGLLAARRDFPALRKFFGDSIKGTPDSATSASAWASRSVSWSARSRSRCPESRRSRSAWPACLSSPSSSASCTAPAASTGRFPCPPTWCCATSA